MKHMSRDKLIDFIRDVEAEKRKNEFDPIAKEQVKAIGDSLVSIVETQYTYRQGLAHLMNCIEVYGNNRFLPHTDRFQMFVDFKTKIYAKMFKGTRYSPEVFRATTISTMLESLGINRNNTPYAQWVELRIKFTENYLLPVKQNYT